MSQIYILYHANCHDGFWSAYAAWKKFGDQAKYHPINDRINYPAFIPDGSEVYLLDFCYKRAVIEELQERMNKLIILDHHITTRDDLKGFSGAYFDMNRSGCVMAWEYFHITPAPLLLLYIQDNDIYTKKLPFNSEITAYSFSIPFDFVRWDEACKLFDDIEQSWGMTQDSFPVKVGSVLGEYRDIIHEKMFDRLIQWKTIAGYKIPAVNVPREFWWGLCKRMIENFPNAPFVAYFYETKKGIEWSLRSKEFDVEAIARKFGWGWHKNAAGFIRMDKTEDIIDLPKEE